MTFPVAQSFQIEKFAQIHPTVFEQDHIFHLRPWRSCFPRGAGTNQAWILGWGFAELLCHPFPGRKAFLGRKQQDGGQQQSQNLTLGSLQALEELPGTSQGVQ